MNIGEFTIIVCPNKVWNIDEATWHVSYGCDLSQDRGWWLKTEIVGDKTEEWTSLSGQQLAVALDFLNCPDKWHIAAIQAERIPRRREANDVAAAGVLHAARD